MRLIDADVFKQRYCESNCGKRKCFDSMDKCVFIDALDEQPTAFDIENIISELNEKAENHGGEDYYVEIGDAVEIVKRGGVSNDACEWKHDKDFDGMYKTCSVDVIYLKGFRYCPYCGKKIKVVE